MKGKFCKIKFGFITKFIIVLLLVNISVFQKISAQDELGIYSIKNYSSKEYDGSAQNWGIVQDHRGIIYVASETGVLEYDGQVWRTIEITSSTKRSRSIGISKEGKIFVGAVGDFGYLKPDTIGNLKFISLINLVDSSNHKYISDIWYTICNDNGVYFISKDKVFFYNGKSIKLFHSGEGRIIAGAFLIENKLFTTFRFYGLATIKGDSVLTVKGADKFFHKEEHDAKAKNDLKAVLPYGKNTILALTSNMGIKNVTLNTNGDIIKVESFKTQLDSFLTKLNPLKIAYINKNDIAIGTNGNGVFIINKNGKLQYVINEETGLQNQVIISQFVDVNSNLWLTLSNGISKVDINSPITNFREEVGLKETVECITRFNDTLYLATHTGIYILNKQKVIQDPKSDIIYQLPICEKFSSSKQLDKQCFDLVPFQYKEKNVLIVATGNSVLEIDSKRNITPIYELSEDAQCYPFCIHQLRKMPNRILIGAEPGLYSARYEDGKWVKEGKIEGIDKVVYKIYEEDNRTIWLGAIGVAIRIDKLSVDGDKVSIVASKSFSAYTEEGLVEGTINVQKFKDKLVFGTSNGLYYYSEEHDSLLPYQQYKDKIFAPDSSFFESFANKNVYLHRLTNDSKNRLWIEAMLNNGKLMTVMNTEPESDKINYVFVDDTREFIQSIFHDGNNTWLGGSNGLIKYNEEVKRDSVKAFNAQIRSVIAGKDTVFYGAFYDENNKVIIEQPEFLIPEIKYKNNSLVFYFAAMSAGDQSKVKYSFFLEGNDDDWSDWKNVTDYPYTNLREGTYYFRVKARDIYGNMSRETVYEFVIKPPWYRTIWAYIGYVLLFIAFVYGAIQVSTRSLQKIIQERTAEIREQKDLIEEKNKDIMDSIKYARRIQETILPSDAKMKKYLPNSFVLYKPRDIVSGDFYWMMHRDDITIIAAADCTGHGVPGAFMSIMGVTFLNEVAAKKEVNSSAEVLNQLRANIIGSLSQRGEEGATKDGMDIALLALNWKSMTVQYAGAYNPLYLIRDGELLETKPDRMPIGLHQRDQEPFTNHIVDLKKGDVMYIFSDGYIDQFGGPKGKKFMSKKFKELLLEVHQKPMDEQKEILIQRNLDWRGEIEQVDDIIVIGIRV